MKLLELEPFLKNLGYEKSVFELGLLFRKPGKKDIKFFVLHDVAAVSFPEYDEFHVLMDDIKDIVTNDI